MAYCRWSPTCDVYLTCEADRDVQTSRGGHDAVVCHHSEAQQRAGLPERASFVRYRDVVDHLHEHVARGDAVPAAVLTAFKDLAEQYRYCSARH